MEHTINDFKKECDTTVYEGQEQYTRDEVKSLIWSQIAILHNDINDAIYEYMKKQTIEIGLPLRNWNDEEKDIMAILKEPRCVKF
jgi:hypothetical protein